MASPTSRADAPTSWPGAVIRHDDFAGALAERRRALGEPAMPRNAGTRRTASKAAMLTALEKLGAEW